MTRRRWLSLIGVALALSVAGCAHLPFGGASSVESGLSQVFGSRLGRVKSAGDSVTFEVHGAVSDADLFASLLASQAHRWGRGTLGVNALLADDGWQIRGLSWDRRSGRLELRGGTGGEPMVKTYPEGVHVAFASTGWVDGVMKARVDLARLKRLSGEEQPQWVYSRAQ